MAAELEKLEDVQGLKFQHALLLPNSGASDGGQSMRALIVGKYNLLIKYVGTDALFYDLQKVIDRKGVEDSSLLMKLEVGARIVSIVSGVDHSESGRSRVTVNTVKGSSNRGVSYNRLDVEDVLLIETVDSVYVYSLVDNSYLYTYKRNRRNRKSASEDSAGSVDRLWYRVTSTAEALLLLVVDYTGRFSLIDIATGAPLRGVELQSQDADDDGVGKLAQDEVKLVGNVHSNRTVCVTRSNKVYVVELTADQDENGVFELKIRPTSSGPEDIIGRTLSGKYEVVGCHLEKDMVLLAVIVPEHYDNVVLMCSMGGNDASGSRELVVEGYCYNELFLMMDSPEPASEKTGSEDVWIRFKYVDEWDLFIAYSNRSTSTLLMTGSSRVVEVNGGGKVGFNGDSTLSNGEQVKSAAPDGTERCADASKYHVLLMSEGYCLESNDFDACILDVFMYTNYKNEIYRKFALEDTPTLKDPVMVGLLTDSGDVSLFYVDRHVIGSDNKEVEVMCDLYRKEADRSISSTGSERGKVSVSVSSKSKNELGAGEDDLGLIDGVKEFSLLTGGNATASSSGIGMSLEKKGNKQAGGIDGISGKKGGDDVDIGDARVDTHGLIDKYYREGYEHYRGNKRMFKLHESLSNSLDYFNAKVSSAVGAGGSDEDGSGVIPVSNSISSSCNTNCKLDKLKDYMVIIKKLLSIQQNIHETLTSMNASERTKNDNGGGAGVGGVGLSVNGDLSVSVNGKDGYREIMDRIYDLIDSVAIEAVESVAPDQLAEVESSLLYINSALSGLNRRFDGLESRLSDVHNKLVYEEVSSCEASAIRPANRSGHVSSVSEGLSGTGARQEGGSGSSSVIEKKLERLMSDVVGLYNQPLLDLSSDLGKMAVSSGCGSASAGNTGDGATGVRGGAKLRYSNYEALFKGPSDAENAAFIAKYKEEDGSMVSKLGLGPADSSKSGSFSFGSVEDATLGREDESRSGTSLQSNASANMSHEPPKNVTNDSLGVSYFITDAKGGNTARESGELGKVRFGTTTNLLTGYSLVGSSLGTVGGGTVTCGLEAGAANRGSSVFAEFNTNRSLLDIALNSSAQAPSAAGHAFPSPFSNTGSVGLPLISGSVSGGAFTGVGNFAANSFTAEGALFGSAAYSHSVFNKGSGVFPASSSSVGSGIAGGNMPFPSSAGVGSGLFNSQPTSGAIGAPGSDNKLDGDIWGTSRRSNPLD